MLGTAQCKTTAAVKEGCKPKTIFFTDDQQTFYQQHNFFFLIRLVLKHLNLNPSFVQG